MAKHDHITTDASTSPLPAPLPSLKDAFAIRREIFGPVPSGDDEQPTDTLMVFLRDGANPHAIGAWTLGAIVVATVALQWFVWVF